MRMRALTGLLLCVGACSGVAFDPEAPPPSGSSRIGAVQGTGATSPLAGATVTVAGVVTGDFQDGDVDAQRNLRGFFLQGAADGDPASSDGIFVFDGTRPNVDVDVGDTVEVTGKVTEYHGETQIDAAAVRVTGTGTVQPVPLSLPAASSTSNSDGRLMADLEHLEGMLVEIAVPLTVTDLLDLERYGEVTLSAQGRLYQFTNDHAPDVAGYRAHLDLVARRSIVLDDGSRAENPSTLIYLSAGRMRDYPIRLGDTITGLTGNLRYSRGAGGNGVEDWRLEPVSNPVFVPSNPRPGAPDLGGSLRVGAFNVQNFFTTIDQGQAVCGPRRDSACRGADSNAEFARQREKTVTALLMSGADILGLTELQNNGDASLRTLVAAMNARAGDGAFAWIDTGIIHTDVIKAGLIYRTTAVSPAGGFALLDRDVDPRFNDSRNRPSLAQTFVLNSNGARLTVVVNHLKSKGSPCTADGDPDTRDGQGNCNQARIGAVAALADWIRTDPTASGDPDFLVVGDMNAYFAEDPINLFRDAGLVDLLAGQSRPYSFLYQGQSGAYDYAFASRTLAPQVTGASEWHINVDEPPVLDYNLDYGRDPRLFDPDVPFRAADHDPVIVGIELAD